MDFGTVLIIAFVALAIVGGLIALAVYKHNNPSKLAQFEAQARAEYNGLRSSFGHSPAADAPEPPHPAIVAAVTALQQATAAVVQAKAPVSGAPSNFGYGGDSPYAGKVGPNGYPLDTRGFEIVPEAVAAAKPFDADSWALGQGYAWTAVVGSMDAKPGFDFPVLADGNYHIDGGWGAADSEAKWRIVKDGLLLKEEDCGGTPFKLTAGVAQFYCEANKAALPDAVLAARAGSGGVTRVNYILRRDF